MVDIFLATFLMQFKRTMRLVKYEKSRFLFEIVYITRLMDLAFFLILILPSVAVLNDLREKCDS